MSTHLDIPAGDVDADAPAGRGVDRAPFRSVWLRAAALFGFWTLPGLLIASQLYFVIAAGGQRVTWLRLVAWQVIGWYYWAFATPGILWFCRRLPLERRRWLRVVPVHLALAVLAALLHITYAVLVTKLLAPQPYSTFALPRIFSFFLFQGFHLDLLIYSGVLGIGYGLAYYRKYRERELQTSQLQAQLAQAQLQALKMQLHPHFLFNTLNAVAGLVRTNNNREAISMLAGLSELLRMALDNSGEQEVTLRQELDFLDRYLRLQQIRFRDRLQVQRNIEPELLDACVPNLILQPLVENAIRHGIARRSSAGRLQIDAVADGETLRLVVRDDGPGLDTTAGQPLREGVGLSNTRKRLRQLYGERQRLTLENGDEAGTVATIEMPLHRAAEQ